MKGKCNCGKVEFELVGKIPNLYQCHCSLCRRQAGSASNSSTIVTTENFRWLSGEDNITSWIDDSGFRSEFCTTCGSPVPNKLKNSQYYWIPMGLVSDADLVIGVHLFVGSKASWDVISSAGVQYEEMPELSVLLEVLNADGFS